MTKPESHDPELSAEGKADVNLTTNNPDPAHRKTALIGAARCGFQCSSLYNGLNSHTVTLVDSKDQPKESTGAKHECAELLIRYKADVNHVWIDQIYFFSERRRRSVSGTYTKV